MSSVLELLENASRPFKEVEVEVNGQPIKFLTRSLSHLEVDAMNKAFNTEFDKITTEMEAGNHDVNVIKRGLQRQSKEKLCMLITTNDRTEYLLEASSELDDKPFSDPNVQSLADEKQKIAYNLLMGAQEEEILEKAIERRAFVVASLKATDWQNLHFVYFSCYEPQTKEKVFPNIHKVGELDRRTITEMIRKINDALRGSAVNPLKSRAKKRPEKPTSSSKSSVEE